MNITEHSLAFKLLRFLGCVLTFFFSLAGESLVANKWQTGINSAWLQVQDYLKKMYFGCVKISTEEA